MSGRVFILMGVSGSGKTAVGKRLAERTGASLVDGDFLHPRANVLKMAAGEPLDDEDRAPWLERVSDAIFAMGNVDGVSLLVCSALKRRYRDRLRQGNEGLVFLYLKGGRDLVAERMAGRSGHFFKRGMLVSQFEALEEPEEDEKDVIVIDIDQPLDGVVEEIMARTGIC